jgi:poly(hydroxyalkanoate) granule-associated protein
MARTKRTTRTTRKAVGTLLKQGAALQVKGRKLAIAKAKEARKAVLARADDARTRTVDAVSQLEGVFEERVGKAISKLGVPTSKDVRALSRQVAQLQQSVDSLRRSRARA